MKKPKKIPNSKPLSNVRKTSSVCFDPIACAVNPVVPIRRKPHNQ